MKDKAKLQGALGTIVRTRQILETQPSRYRPQLWAVLCALWSHADQTGKCSSGYKTLKRETGLSEKTLTRVFKRLVALKVVSFSWGGGWNRDTQKPETKQYCLAPLFRLIGGGVPVGQLTGGTGRSVDPINMYHTCAESFSEKTPPPEASTDAPDTGLVTVPPEIAPIPGNQARDDTAGAISSGTAVENPHPVGALGTDEAGMVLKAVFSVDTRGKRPSEIQREKAREVDKVLNLFPRRGNTRAAIPDTPRDDESRTAHEEHATLSELEEVAT